VWVVPRHRWSPGWLVCLAWRLLWWPPGRLLRRRRGRLARRWLAGLLALVPPRIRARRTGRRRGRASGRSRPVIHTSHLAVGNRRRPQHGKLEPAARKRRGTTAAA